MRFFGLMLILLGTVSSGCMTTGAPRNWLSTPEEAQSEAYGGWAMVRYYTDTVRYTSGELLAVEADSIHILSGTTWRAIARRDITEGRVAVYNPRSSTVAVWNTLGTLSTISHGFLLILSAPVWLISSPFTHNAPVRRARPTIDRDDWDRAASFARFPGGVPVGIDRASLQPKVAGV